MIDRFLRLLGIVLLVFQGYMMIHARFNEQRYFCWAPFDAQNEYEINAIIDTRLLTPQELKARYRILDKGVDPRAIQHVKDIIAQYESTYGRGQQAFVELRYKVNGVPQQTWIWKP